MALGTALLLYSFRLTSGMFAVAGALLALCAMFWPELNRLLAKHFNNVGEHRSGK